jgi:predicted kinase
MEAILLIGIPATGKSTFWRERYADTHIRLNMDMLKTRHRERILLAALVESKQPFVSDNTNASKEERIKYIEPAKAAGFRVVGYYFESKVSLALERDAGRMSSVGEQGILGTAGRLERPNAGEGFDELFYVRLTEGEFIVEPWLEDLG